MAGKKSSPNISKTQERVIKLIAKPSSQRTNMEIDFVLPWLKKKSDVFMKISNAILKEIVRNCDFLRTEKDDVIIRQGDTGDCLYILLRGSVAVFIKETPTGDDFTIDMGPSQGHHGDGAHTKNWQQIAQEICEDLAIKKNKKMDRASFGKKIVTIGAGKAFGEIALLSTESIRTASILSDESCDLMVVNRKLYNSTLKSYHERDFEERRHFIEQSPLFRNWNPRMKKQLERSLIKEYHSADTNILKQGDKLKGLVFIREGHAKVLIEPAKHEHQYPHMAPFPKEGNIYDIECLRGRKLKRSKSSSDANREQSSCSSTQVVDRPYDGNLGHQGTLRKSLTFEQIHVKRKEGYAAAERRITHRSVVLCTVREGAMFGDIEMSQNLKTYSQTVVTLVPTETYSISTKNVERLIQKRSPTTMKKLMDIVLWKMCSRSTSVQGNVVPLIQHLVFKMGNDSSPNPSKLPPIQEGKHPPQGERMLRNLVKEYLNDKAQLIVPYVPGGVYYKTVMRKRAAERAKVRRRREKIRLEMMEKELRHQLAKSIDYNKVLDSGWNLSATDNGSSESDEEYTSPRTDSKLQKRLTPRIFSQSDPILSRPSSCRDDGARAFMTEVEVVDRARQNDAETAVEKGEPQMQPILGGKDNFVKTKNYTVCLVYDEASGSSLIKHYGASSKQATDALAVYDNDDQTTDDDSSDAEDSVFTTHGITDSEMVGASKHIAGLNKRHRLSSSGIHKKGSKEDDHSQVNNHDNAANFLPSINVTMAKIANKVETDDDTSQPPESARHSFSAPHNTRVRIQTATSVPSRRKSTSTIPLPRVTSSEAPIRPSGAFIAQFLPDKGNDGGNGQALAKGEHYTDIIKPTTSVINPVS